MLSRQAGSHSALQHCELSDSAKVNPPFSFSSSFSLSLCPRSASQTLGWHTDNFNTKMARLRPMNQTLWVLSCKALVCSTLHKITQRQNLKNGLYYEFHGFKLHSLMRGKKSMCLL